MRPGRGWRLRGRALSACSAARAPVQCKSSDGPGMREYCVASWNARRVFEVVEFSTRCVEKPHSELVEETLEQTVMGFEIGYFVVAVVRGEEEEEGSCYESGVAL